MKIKMRGNMKYKGEKGKSFFFGSMRGVQRLLLY